MYDYIYIYIDSAGIVRTRWGSLRLAIKSTLHYKTEGRRKKFCNSLKGLEKYKNLMYIYAQPQQLRKIYNAHTL